MKSNSPGGRRCRLHKTTNPSLATVDLNLQRDGLGWDLISAGAARATAPQQRTILAHYERVAPLIAANFLNVPLVFTYYPDGLGTKPTFSNNHETLPETVPHVPVTPSSGSHIYPGCAVNTILYYIRTGAVGVHSWTPAPSDPDAVDFARMLLKPIAGATQTQLRDASRERGQTDCEDSLGDHAIAFSCLPS